MSTSIDIFTQDVHRCFTDLFQKLAGPADSRFLLAFLPLGSPVSPPQFKLHATDANYDSAVALEQCSDLANSLPTVESAVYMKSLAHLSDQYGLLLNAAPVEGIDDSVFVNIKADAVRQFSATLGSMDQNNQLAHHPAFATPKDWYDPSNLGNWTDYKFQFGEQSSTQSGTPPARPPLEPPPARNWAWQVLPRQMAVLPDERPPGRPIGVTTMPGTLQHPRVMMMAAHPSNFAVPPETMIASNRTFTIATALQPRTAVLNAATTAVKTPAAPLMVNVSTRLKLSTQLASAQLVAGNTQQQHVEANSLKVFFQYCMVQVDRPWLSSAFLENRNWFLPGYPSASLASGQFDASFSTPVDAPLSALPVAFIVVKGLKISGNWGASDLQALSQSAGLGPFSILERASATTSTDIVCDGMQIIAWFCQALPPLPPQSDPALAVNRQQAAVKPDAPAADAAQSATT